MQVRDIMTTDLRTVGEQTPFREVVAVLLDYDIGAVPVVDDARFVGLVTESDLLSKEAFPAGRARRTLRLVGDVLAGGDIRWLVRASGLTAREVMSTDVRTVSPDEDVSVAARDMLEFRVGHLPVVEDGWLVGIVSRRDLLKVLIRPDNAVALEVDEALRGLADELDHDVHAAVDGGVVTLVGGVARADDGKVITQAVEAVAGVSEVQAKIGVRADN